MKDILTQLSRGEDLPADAMAAAIGVVMRGEATPAQVGALLMGLRVKGETPDEIAGAARAMRASMRALPHAFASAVDTAGTGGDGGRTFNISTAAALVAAGAGVKIAKHGNRAVSSKCGSADVLEKLGIKVQLDAAAAARCFDEVGIVFMFAPHHHPAMANVMPARKELGVRTIFNLIGPLANPAGVRRQIIGVYAPEVVEKVARALVQLGCDRTLVVHGWDGVDELSLCDSTHVAEVRGKKVLEYDVSPEDFGLDRCAPEDLSGEDAADNAQTLRDIVEGREQGPRADAVLLNAAAAIAVSSDDATLEDGLVRAREAVRSGAAARLLQRWIAFA